MKVVQKEIRDLVPYANNARTHSEAQIAQLASSISTFGFNNPVLIDAQNGIIAGHGRVMAAAALELKRVPTICLDHLDDDQRRAYVLADNKLALEAGWDDELLKLELADLKGIFDLDAMGFSAAELADLEKLDKYADGVSGSLADEFGVAPFSVLDTRKAEWIERRREWQQRIGDNGETRRGTLGFESFGGDWGNSVLDATLAETMVNWFGVPGGQVFDPFAGDTVFGYVSASMGMEFHGIELRQEQCDLNQARCTGLAATYYCDTSANMDAHVADASMDMVFSCPPYFDLEQYSDDPADISNMTLEDFYQVYTQVFTGTYRKLKNDRFAVIVVGEVRGKEGGYISLVPETIRIMQQAGYVYYNEIILVNSAGTLPLRAGKSMRASRKVGKNHQNVLVFVKGDPVKAVQAMGEVTLDESADV